MSMFELNSEKAIHSGGMGEDLESMGGEGLLGSSESQNYRPQSFGSNNFGSQNRMGGGPVSSKKKKQKKAKRSKKAKVVDEPNLINTDDLREGTEPMIDLDFEQPPVEAVKPMKKSNKKWSEPKPENVE